MASTEIFNKRSVSLPYAYVTPSINFEEGSTPNNYNEIEYSQNFFNGFEKLYDGGYKAELEYLEMVQKHAENQKMKMLETDLFKDKNKIQYDSALGSFKIEVDSSTIFKKSNLKLVQQARKELHAAKPKREKMLNLLMDNSIYTAIQSITAEDIISILFENKFEPHQIVTPKEIWDALPNTLKTGIINIEQNAPFSAPITKLVRNLLSYYTKKKLKDITEEEKKMYEILKNYDKIAKERGQRSKASSFTSSSNGFIIQEFVESFQRSFSGAVKQKLGSQTETLIKNAISNAVKANGGNINGIKLSGKSQTKVNTSIAFEVELPDIEEILQDDQEEEYLKKIYQQINKNAFTGRNPKADIMYKKMGISIKATSLFSKHQNNSHNITLHHGTYISLIRYLTRFKGTEGIVSMLMQPSIQHAVLNLSRSRGAVESESLNTALEPFSYIFIGTNAEEALTDYGLAMSDIKNDIVAFIDLQGNGRFVSDILKELLNNLKQYTKKSLGIIFKDNTRGLLTHFSEDQTPYTTSRVFKQNTSGNISMSQIEVEAYMRSFNF